MLQHDKDLITVNEGMSAGCAKLIEDGEYLV